MGIVLSYQVSGNLLWNNRSVCKHQQLLISYLKKNPTLKASNEKKSKNKCVQHRTTYRNLTKTQTKPLNSVINLQANTEECVEEHYGCAVSKNPVCQSI